jgi:hypothetical protein
VPVLQFGDRERCYHRRHRFPHDITRRGAGRDRIVRQARGTRLEDNAARRSWLMVDLVNRALSMRYGAGAGRAGALRFTVDLNHPKLM